MLSAATLATWIRAEYESMPGLKLSREQACRLWSVQGETCDQALQALIDEGFLHRTGTGKFVYLPSPLGRAARPSRDAHVRCPHCQRLTVVPEREAGQAGTISYRCDGCRRIVTLTALSA